MSNQENKNNNNLEVNKKTQVCSYLFNRQCCPYATKCRFGHTPAEITDPALCKNEKCSSAYCYFFHPNSENLTSFHERVGVVKKNVISSGQKTQVCKCIFNRIYCKYEDNCKFAHTSEQITNPTMCNNKTITNCNKRCLFYHCDTETLDEYYIRVGLVKTEKKYNPPVHLFNQTFSVDYEPSIMKQIIGYNGAHFKNITIVSGVSYIWYNREDKYVEIWGVNTFLITNAYTMLEKHITHILEYVKNKTTKK